jgi:tetratricopeptide (TPR) repeat protein
LPSLRVYREMPMHCRIAIAFLLLMGAAGAQEMRSLARQKFDEGRVQFAAGHYDQALEHFKRSYDLAPHPDLLFNIGRCLEELNRYREAYEAYEKFLAVNPNDKDVQGRAYRMRRKAIEEPLPVPEAPPEPTPMPASVVVARQTDAPTPVYKKWWLWTAVVGVAAVALGVGLGVGLSGSAPESTFPPLSAR